MLPWMTYGGAVRDSAELRRIKALPRRTAPPVGSELLTSVLAIGEQQLRPIQAQALAELYLTGGLLGLIRVGGGKTLITYLAPEMLKVSRPLLLIPAKLREKTKREFQELSQHWRQNCITIESYERLGRAQWSTYLDDFKPDMLICDEVHKIKNVRAAVTRRVARYMSAHPETHFLGLSGTVTRRSLMDFVHLAEWALGDQAPVPLVWADLQEWCCALDEDSQIEVRYAPGALETLIEGTEDVRQAVRRRLVETPGVVATNESPIDASLLIDDWWPEYKPPDELKLLYEEWQLPDGQLLMSAADVWRHAQELALGFYYKWEPEPPQWWLEPRRRWAAFVREKLLRSRTMDSPSQVVVKHKDSKLYKDWDGVRKEYEPEVVPIWIFYSVIDKIMHWVENEGIVWIKHKAIAQELEQRHVPYYGSLGQYQGQQIEDATGGIAASIEANKEGRNLQRFNRNLILTPPSTGLAWEQLLGRTHRDGQQADEVLVEVFFGCRESIQAFFQARNDAKYQQGLTGSPQKLLEATLAFER